MLFLDSVKPSVCSYSSLFAMGYLNSHIVSDITEAPVGSNTVEGFARDYCSNLEDSILKKLQFINSALSLDLQAPTYES